MKTKNKAAQALGRKGARVTNAKLTREQRQANARKAANTRWDKQRAKEEKQ